MNKENTNDANSEKPLIRVTRARAKALGVSGEMPWQEQKRVLRAKSKRAEADESRSSVATNASFQHKRRAVLKDVTNLDDASEAQIKRRDLAKQNAKQVPPVQEDAKTKLAEELSKIKVDESEEQLMNSCKDSVANKVYPRLGFRSFKKKEEGVVFKNAITSEVSDIKDIDSNFKDPQACSLYAHDIYSRLRITELERRPSVDYMEELQSDINPNMRAILIDWLVEVSEEYKLVPDTLYLTVNLIDRFLSHNHIEKQKLQLLGVACMLIASKYEEICAPRAEEFCFITDSTYTRGEVLKMESDVLNFLHFHLSIPTAKTFLRRFIHAAKYSYEDPCLELEFLANYLAELTLVDHKFLKFLPSLVAASAVFLSRWTLNQSDQPWNSTLEHYTGYTVSELKNTVLAMEALQADSNGCPKNAIREKYRQQKFKSVSTLTSTKPVDSVL